MVTRNNRERTAWLELWIATCAFTVCFYAWTLYGPLAPALQKDLGLSGLQVSWLVAIPVVLGSIMRIPLGYLSQRYGGKSVFIWLMLFLLIPLLGIAFWHSHYAMLLFFGFFVGFAGASFAVGVPFVSNWFPPERRGYALGIYGVGTGGTVLAGLIVPALESAFGIFAPIGLAMVLLVVVALVYIYFGLDAPSSDDVPATMLTSYDVFWTSSRAWILTLVYFVTFGGFVAMFLYLPQILVTVSGLSRTDAGFRAAGFALVAVVARPIGGSLADRFGAERVLIYSLAWAAAMAALLAATYTSMLPLTFCCLTLAAAFGAGSGAVFKVVGTDFPQSVGAVTGVVGAAGGLGGFFPPLVMGLVKTLTGTYALGFALLGVVCALCLALILPQKASQSTGTRPSS